MSGKRKKKQSIQVKLRSPFNALITVKPLPSSNEVSTPKRPILNFLVA